MASLFSIGEVYFHGESGPTLTVIGPLIDDGRAAEVEIRHSVFDKAEKQTIRRGELDSRWRLIKAR